MSLQAAPKAKKQKTNHEVPGPKQEQRVKEEDKEETKPQTIKEEQKVKQERAVKQEEVKKESVKKEEITKTEALRNDQNEPYFEVSSKRRVTVRTWKGKILVDIREYYEKDGKFLPGKKGISLTIDQFDAIVKAKDDISTEIARLGKDPKSTTATKLATNDKGEATVELGSNRKALTISTYKGSLMVGIREFYEKGGKMLPGKKGISFPAEQYNVLRQLIESGSIQHEVKVLAGDGE